VLMVSAQLGVVEIQAARRGHRRDPTGLRQRAGLADARIPLIWSIRTWLRHDEGDRRPSRR
jgi:hypothetical protein